MTELAPIGHNGHDPIDEALVPFGEVISEAEGWLDGQKVTTEGQMKACDALIKGVKAARKAVDDARDTATKPLHDAWKAEVARWKPTQDDLDRIVKGLVGLVDDFKRKLAAEKEAARKAAERAAWEKAEAARIAAQAASVSDIEAQRAVAKAQADAEEAQRQAALAAKDTVKGLRTVTLYEVTDHRALLHWIVKNDRDAVTAFIDDWARRNHKENPGADGLRVWQEKVAV